MHERGIVLASDGDGQSGRVARDQIACVLDGVAEHIGNRHACCQRVGRIGDVAVAAVGCQRQVAVEPGQRGGNTFALRDAAHAGHRSADQQRGGAVVDIGVSTCAPNHTVGDRKRQRRVFIDCARIVNRHWQVVHAGHGDGQRAGVGNQGARVFHRVSENIGCGCAGCQRVGRVGNVAVAAVCGEGQVTVAACQRSAYTGGLCNGASTRDCATDQQ